MRSDCDLPRWCTVSMACSCRSLSSASGLHRGGRLAQAMGVGPDRFGSPDCRGPSLRKREIAMKIAPAAALVVGLLAAACSDKPGTGSATADPGGAGSALGGMGGVPGGG